MANYKLSRMSQIQIQVYKKVAQFILESFGGTLCLLDFRYRKMPGVVVCSLRGICWLWSRELDPSIGLHPAIYLVIKGS
jgi:hypothetical protein